MKESPPMLGMFRGYLGKRYEYKGLVTVRFPEGVLIEILGLDKTDGIPGFLASAQSQYGMRQPFTTAL